MLSLKELAREEISGEDPLVTGGEEPAWLQAEAYRKAGDFDKAGPFFFEEWKDTHRAAAGWRYAFCLRKAGYAEAALRVAYKVAQAHPEEKPAIQEKIWSLYQARLKPALDANRHHEVLQIAEEMVQAGADSFALKIAVFSGLRAAKESRQWEKILQWCAQLDPQELTTAPRKMGERKVLADRERYYYARIKALVELKRWEECLDECERAQRDFDRNQDFVRWQAQALAGLGDVEPALQVLDKLRAGGRARWYVLSDYSRQLLQSNHLELAWEVALEATRAPVEDSHKLGLFETMANIALKQGRQQAAVDHLGWCLALRHSQGWNKTSSLEELELQLCHVQDHWDPPDPSYWKDRSRLHWGLAAPAPAKDQQRHQGVVEQFMVNRNYCFVLSKGERYYTLMKDVPQSCRKDGARVAFSLTPHYDPKKKTDSQRAIQLSPA